MTPTSDNAVRAQPALLVAMVLAALDQWATFARTGCKLPRRELQAYSKEGDIMFGALAPVNIETLPAAFSFTQPPAPRNCNRTYPEMYQCVLAMAFATEEINQNSQILPNLTLGFRIVDSCYTESGALQSILWLLAGQNNTLPNYRCQPNIKAPAIIGDVFSSASVEMARTLGCLNIPQVERKRSFCPLVFIPDSNSISTKKINQGDLAECAKKIGLLQVTVNSLKGFPKIYEGMISYGSGLPLLSDKIQFPSFVRTCPSTGEVPYILVQIVIHFGWTWVGILGSNSEYGLYGIMELKKEFSLSHVCVAFLDTLRSDSTRARILATVQTIKESTATVIILYAFAPEVIPIIEELVAQEVTGKIWIISPSLIGSPLFSRQDLWKLLNGTIGVGNHAVGLPLFKVFQHQNRPTTSYGDIFIRPFWEHVFHCRWEDGRTSVNATYNRTVGGINVCTGQEQLETLPSSLYDANNLRFSYKAYNAVYTFAHAMHNLLSCDHAKSRCSGSMEDIQPWQLLHVVRNIHFKNPMGEDVYFNEHGDPPHVGDILNWQLSQDGTSRYVYVGIYDSQLPQDQRVRIYADRILWGKGHIEVPQSVCSKACPLGFREAAQEGKPVCCFDCVLCPEGEIANTTGMKNCLKCSQDHWSDPQRIECHKKRLEFLKFQETLGTVLSVASIVLTLTTAWVLSVFIRHSETPIVRANNRTLSYLILFSLILCFLCPLLFIGRPERWSCILRQMVFGVVFSLCESCILAKTMIVVLAFKARVPNSRYRSWLAVKIPFSIVLICLFTQFLLCITWLGLSPPFLEFNMKDSVDKIFLQCNENSETAFYSMLGFLSLLACLSFVVAFKARKLPDRFNETKWITFSMMVFLSVWASFLPAYLSTKGKYMVAVEIFAILSSSAGVLVCIFFPKCYTVLLKPEMNTRKKQ